MSPSPRPSPFPPGFLWGAATSAYQIEGSPLADGAGESIWHRFAHAPGRVAHGDHGDVACDHYRRWREDIALMRDLGLTAYRFSIAWGRVQPLGRGPINPAGLDFYRRLVDALVEARIAPLATLFHWDLPQALEERGGWLERDTAKRFADYASICFGALDAGVHLWATLNEPWVVTDGGYLHGTLAPGRTSAVEAASAAHQLLLAHAEAVHAYRAVGRKGIGIVLNLEPKHPISAAPADLAAARRADAYMNRHYLEPVLLGRYPEELAEVYGSAWRPPPAEDLAVIAAPLDYLGINYYSRSVVRADPAAGLTQAARVRQDQAPHTELDWEIYPEGLYETLMRVHALAPALPLYVLENGAACADPPAPVGGSLDDPLRVVYLREHLRSVARALAAGADVRGYCVWSLFDNLEWAQGYAMRFGLVHVDRATQARTLKASAHFYRELIRSHGADLVG